MAKGMQSRHAAPLALLGSFAIFLSPLPTHGSLTTPGLVIWQEGLPHGSFGWLLALLATVLVFQALLGLLIYWTLWRPSWQLAAVFVVFLPFLATLFGVALFSVLGAF